MQWCLAYPLRIICQTNFPAGLGDIGSGKFSVPTTMPLCSQIVRHSLSSIPVNHFQQLIVHRLSVLGGTGTNRVGSAVSEVVTHQSPGNRAKSLLCRRDLRENIRAIAIFFHHPLQPANLAFNPAQSPQVRSLDCRIDFNCFAAGQISIESTKICFVGAVFLSGLLPDHAFPHTSFNRRRRRLFVTTLKELSAMAALAITGLSSNPNTG